MQDHCLFFDRNNEDSALALHWRVIMQKRQGTGTSPSFLCAV